jgi:hypothetical protein
MDNPEILATRRRQIKQKRNKIGVRYHYTQTNTNNVNKYQGQTWAINDVCQVSKLK